MCAKARSRKELGLFEEGDSEGTSGTRPEQVEGGTTQASQGPGLC